MLHTNKNTVDSQELNPDKRQSDSAVSEQDQSIHSSDSLTAAEIPGNLIEEDEEELRAALLLSLSNESTAGSQELGPDTQAGHSDTAVSEEHNGLSPGSAIRPTVAAQSYNSTEQEDELLYVLLLSHLPSFDFDEKVELRVLERERSVLDFVQLSNFRKRQLTHEEFVLELNKLVPLLEVPAFNPSLFLQLARLLCNRPRTQADFLDGLDIACLGTYLQSLGIFYYKDYKNSGRHMQLDKAIAAAESAVAALPQDHPAEVGFQVLSNLATYTTIHFNKNRDRASLDSSITAYRKLAICLDAWDPRKPEYLHYLSHKLWERFESFMTLSDLDEMVDSLTQALGFIQGDNSQHYGTMRCLSAALHRRYLYMGYANDLDTLRNIMQQLIDIESDGQQSTILSKSYGNLATCLLSRFCKLRQIPDLNNCIEILQKIITTTPDSDDNKPRFLEDLATALRMRSMDASDQGSNEESVQDLLLAAEAGQKAIDLTPFVAFGTDKAQRFLNQGITYGLLSRCLNDVSYLDEAISLQKNAALLVSDDHPGRGKYLLSLGDSLQERFEFDNNITYAQEALKTFAQAASNTSTEAHTRLISASRMTELCDAHPELASPLDAHKLLLSLIPKLVWLGSHITHRHERMSMVGTAVNAAVAAAIAAGDLDTACEWMEQGRCIVWGQILHLRTPLDALRERDPQLAEELTVVAHELDQAAILEPQMMTLNHSSCNHELSLDRDVSTRHGLAAKYEELLEKAHNVAGMEHLMQPKGLADLRSAAGSGHIILINVHKTRCDALVIKNSSEQATHIPLPNLKHHELHQWYLTVFELLKRSGVRVRGGRRENSNDCDTNEQFMNILEKLWLNVVHPILSGLELLAPAMNSELPRVTWCTSGSLVFLPIHAAGIYKPNQPKIFNYVVSSYAPTITALLTPPVNKQHMPGQVLAVSQPNTPGQQPLPGTSLEMSKLHEEFKELELLILNAASATKEAVLQEMRTPPIRPRVELMDIIKQSFNHTELAVLSACQTAAGATELPEEAVHLVAGMLIAGYRSIIGTMWSVGDQDAPIIAQELYSYLIHTTGGDSTKSAYALHHAVGKLRDRVGEKNFIRWVPFMHTGA
ncbi:CHAT domain-containing protein [Mycena pura]|uniref:CHAT domain-containing protein n=1 Tax=Mycena pura TaxID=153505 RepID=A0AAD7E5J5_9AGAR|nr:CHAT domain-containing protein [Mycena pura]